MEWEVPPAAAAAAEPMDTEAAGPAGVGMGAARVGAEEVGEKRAGEERVEEGAPLAEVGRGSGSTHLLHPLSCCGAQHDAPS